MDGIFTIPYPEYCVAQQLSRLLPAKDGYSLHAPLSRQERGIDLVVTRRSSVGTKVATIQVKGSRTYSRPKVTARTRRPFRYYTWFNTFECPPEADFICLVALYPAVDAAQKRELGSWWAPQVLLFSQAEMKHFLGTVKTVAGKPDRMFGFGFDDPKEAFLVRGDPERRFNEHSELVLDSRYSFLREFLG